MSNISNIFFEEKNKIKWYHYLIHLGYYIPYWIHFFFSKPFKEEKKDLRILDLVQSLLSQPDNATNENLEKCRQLVHLHRIIENTKARRRLEKWSLRVIATYLLVVFIIVVCAYCKISIKELWGISLSINIPIQAMITILSTTTINIIGLGLIVLRGHFLAKGSMATDKKMRNKKDLLTDILE